MTDSNNCKKNETTIDECNEVLVPRKYFEKLKSIQLAVDNLFSAIHKGGTVQFEYERGHRLFHEVKNFEYEF